MLDICYESATAGVIPLNSGIYVGKPNDLFSREWDYDLGYRSLTSAIRKARKVSISAAFIDMGAADALRRAADADVAAMKPGRIRIGEWRQRCYIVASSVNSIFDAIVSAKLTAVLLDGVWRRGETTEFVPVNASTGYAFLDMPYDVPYDLGVTPPKRYLIAGEYTTSPVKLTIYGPAVNPAIIIGANTYQVDVTVPDGGYMVIDPINRTVTVTSAEGETMDAFPKAHRGKGVGSGEYIFERVPAGTSEVSWNNAFGFDATVYDEEGEPAWS